MAPKYADLYNLSENDRIRLIGKTVIEQNALTAICVEDNKKADRYIRKLEKYFPGKIAVVDRFEGPVPGTVTIRIRPATSN